MPQNLILTFLFIATSGLGADYDKGFEAYSVGDYATALSEWQRLAEQGEPNGQFGMGLLYANGWGVDLNDDEALRWYTLASDQGHAEAAYNIAVMNANGWGVPQSDAEAFKWYSIAAERGFTAAQTSLGKMYAVGFGVPQDNVQAHMWYNIAAMLDDFNAEYDRDELARMMSPEEIAQAEDLAKAWLENYRAAHAQ
ncbi:MAG: tetratricopeptide repeat protein [Woeseia sp.]